MAISVAIPKWLPPSLALWLRHALTERPEGKLTVATRFSKGERAAMKRRRPVPISAWAEKHRILEMSAIRGRWRNVFTPYLTGIMGRVRASRRRDGHHLQEPPDGRLGVWPQHRRVLHRPSPRPGDVRLPGRADRPRERQGSHHPDDRSLPAPPAVHDGLRSVPPACASTCCTCRFTSAGPAPSRGSGTSPSASSSSTSWTSTRTRKTRHRPSRWRRSARRHGGPGARS